MRKLFSFLIAPVLSFALLMTPALADLSTEITPEEMANIEAEIAEFEAKQTNQTNSVGFYLKGFSYLEGDLAVSPATPLLGIGLVCDNGIICFYPNKGIGQPQFMTMKAWHKRYPYTIVIRYQKDRTATIKLAKLAKTLATKNN